MKTIKIASREEFFKEYRKMQKTHKRVGFKPDPKHKGILNLDITKKDVENSVEYICETYNYDYVFTIYPNKRYNYFSSKNPLY